eukprot:471487_1
MSNRKQERRNKTNQNKADEKERRLRRVNRRELIKLSSQKLRKKCREYKVKYDKTRRNETVAKLLDKIVTKNNKATKKNKKVKRLSLRFSVDDQEEFKQEAQKQQHQMLLRQSNTETTASNFIKTINIINTDLTDNAYIQKLYGNIFNDSNQTATTQHSTIINYGTNENKSENDSVNMVSNNNNKHEKRKSTIDIIACAPKMMYDITGLHGFDTVKDMKDKLPVSVKSTQCKLFYGGHELNDSHTLAQLEIISGSKLKILISWREFKPDPNVTHPRDMEHRHLNKVAELKRLNDFNVFSKLIIGMQKECNKNNKFIIYVGNNEQRVLHEYCICLSGH